MNFNHGANKHNIARKYHLNYHNLIDYSSNVNAYHQPAWLKDVYIQNFVNIRDYPDIDYTKLVSACEVYEQLEAQHLVLANGASSLIFDLVKLLRPKYASILIPTFSEYERALESIDCQIQFHDWQDDLSCIDFANAECIFLCNPNNPTGLLLPLNQIKYLLECYPACSVIVDESFIDFSGDLTSCKSLLSEYDNLFIIKSYTKFFQCAGLRFAIGMTSNSILVDRLKSSMPAWQINGMVSNIVCAYLSDSEFINKARKSNILNRRYLELELKKLGFYVYESQANFICFIADDINLFEKLLAKSVIIRDCHNFRGAKRGMYRVCVSLMDKNIKLIEALKEVLEYEKV